MKFEIEPHSRTDKSFRIKCPGELRLTVDYDDVPHGEVDALAGYMVAILNQRWAPLEALQCRNEDCDDYWSVSASTGPCPQCGKQREVITIG